MDRRTKVAFVAAGLVLISAFAAYLQAQVAPGDPFAKFIMPDGSVSIPGPAFTRQLQQLLFPPPAPTTYTVFYPVHSGYPTLEIRGSVYDISVSGASPPVGFMGSDITVSRWRSPPVDWTPVSESAAQLVSELASLPAKALDGLRGAVRWFFSLFSMSASAADRYAVLNDAGCTNDLWSNTSCWADASGGAGGQTVPGASDNVFFDGNSGSGTMTYDVASSTIGVLFFDDSPQFTGTLAIGNNTLTMTVTQSNLRSGTLTVNNGTLNFNVGLHLESVSGSVFGTFNVTGTATVTWGNSTLLRGPVNVSGVATFIGPVGNEVQFGGSFNVGYLNQTAAATWQIRGNYRNFCTGAPCSTSWMMSAGTFTFSSPNDEAGMRFAGANLSGAEFFNATFESSSAAARAYTMNTNGLNVSGTLTISDSTSTTTLDTSSLSVTAGAVTMGTGGILTAGSSTITVAGNFNTASGTFAIGTSTVVITATSSIATATTSSFYNLTVSGGTATPANNVDVDNDLTLSGGTYAKGTTTLNVDNAGGGDALTMSSGDLTSTSGDATVTGNMNIPSASSAIDLGSETWTITGTWTNASTDSAWDAGTGTVVFTSATGGTMTFAGPNLSENEFNNMTFNSSAGTSQTFTMSTRGLRWGGTLAITDAAGGTILAKGNLTLTGGDITLSGAAGGAITSTAPSQAFGEVNGRNVSISNASYVDFGVESWIISGTWTNNSTNAAWDAGGVVAVFKSTTGGTMTFAGTNLSENEFNIAQFGSDAVATVQTFTMATRGLRIGALLTVEDGTGGGTILDKGTQTIIAGSLSVGGTFPSGITSVSGDVTIAGNVQIIGAFNGFIDFGSETWTVGGAWSTTTMSASWEAGTGTVVFNSSVDRTMTFAGSNLAEDEFNNVTFNSIAGAAQTFTMATRDLRIAGTLTISDGSSTTTLNTSASNFSITAGAVTISAGGILTANGSTITVNGGWNSFSGTFTFGTSTVIFAASGTVTAGPLGGSGNLTTCTCSQFYNITINPGATVAVGFSSIGADGVVTVNGTLTLQSFSDLFIMNVADSADPLVMGPSGIIQSSGVGQSTVVFGSNGATANVVNIPAAGTFTNIRLRLAAVASFPGDGLEYRVTGDLSTVAIDFRPDTVSPVVPFFLNTQTFNISLTTMLVVNASVDYGWKLASGTITIGSNVSLGADMHIQFGDSIWFVSGTWTNPSTNTKWDAGNGTVTFTSATGGTMVFAGTNLAEDEFNNVIFNSSGAATQTFALFTRGLRWAGTLTVTDATSHTLLATGMQPLTGGALTLSGAGGGILEDSGSIIAVTTVNISSASYINFGPSTWTVSGTWTNETTQTGWDGSIGTITFTSAIGGTMTFAGTNLAEAEFNDVTFTSSASTAQTFTMATRDLRLAGTLLVSDASGTTTFSPGPLDLTFAALRVSDGGRLAMNGFDVAGMTVSTNSGDIALTQWTAFTLSPTDVRWTFDPSSSSATITISLSNLANGDYSLKRDGFTVQTAMAVAGTVSFSVTGGWSPHDMQISQTVFLAVDLTGEFDYLEKEQVNISVAAVVRDAETLAPASGADVTIGIYDLTTTLLVSASMTEVLPGTGIYRWTSTGTIKDLHPLFKKGVYLAVVEASLAGDPTTRAVLEFHVDPPGEETVAPGSSVVDMAIGIAATAAAAAGITGLALRRHEVGHALRRLRKRP